MAKNRALILILVSAVFGSDFATAGLITFNFRENLPNNLNTISYVQPPVKLDISAFKDGADADVTRGIAGLGVTGDPGGNNMGYGDDGSGINVAESLLAEFTKLTGVQELTLVSVLIDNMQAADTFDILADGNLLTSVVRSATSGSGPDNRLWTVADPGAARANADFRFVATNGAVRIAELTFSVPEPSTLAIMALGLTGFGYRKRLAAAR